MWFQILSFISYYWKAVTKFNVHSGFIHHFVNDTLDTSKEYYDFKDIETEREILLKSDQKIIFQEFGAGSRTMKQNERFIKDIARTSLSNVEKCRVLFNIVQSFKPNTILELGTSLGISSSYMAKANSSSKMYTLEGDRSIADIANRVHTNLTIKNAEIIYGPFQDTLPKLLNTLNKIDLAFLDGHHAYQPTIDYFNQLLPHIHSGSIVILDDIYWSEEMKQAWLELKDHHLVTLSIDLFYLGILFFNKDLSKEKITYIPFQYKPWKIGLFA